MRVICTKSDFFLLFYCKTQRNILAFPYSCSTLFSLVSVHTNLQMCVENGFKKCVRPHRHTIQIQIHRNYHKHIYATMHMAKHIFVKRKRQPNLPVFINNHNFTKTKREVIIKTNWMNGFEKNEGKPMVWNKVITNTKRTLILTRWQILEKWNPSLRGRIFIMFLQILFCCNLLGRRNCSMPPAITDIFVSALYYFNSETKKKKKLSPGKRGNFFFIVQQK